MDTEWVGGEFCWGIFDVPSSEASPHWNLPSHTRICWPCKDSMVIRYEGLISKGGTLGSLLNSHIFGGMLYETSLKSFEGHNINSWITVFTSWSLMNLRPNFGRKLAGYMQWTNRQHRPQGGGFKDVFFKFRSFGKSSNLTDKLRKHGILVVEAGSLPLPNSSIFLGVRGPTVSFSGVIARPSIFQAMGLHVHADH